MSGSSGRRRPARGQAEVRRAALPRDPERLLDRMPWDAARALLPGDASDRDRSLTLLRRFALELLRWNRGVLNLISHEDETRLVERHMAESLAGAVIINKLGCNELVDFGSGGGFPAIPLAIAGVGRCWTLVESRRNKTLFLRRAIQALGLDQVRVLTGRLEALVSDELVALQCDGFTSRATLRAAPTLALAARIVRPGGHAILWKGSGLNEELAGSRETWERDWDHPVTRAIGSGPNSISVFLRKS